MDLEGMSDHAKEEIQEYITKPPNLFESLKALSGADEILRYWGDDEHDRYGMG